MANLLPDREPPLPELNCQRSPPTLCGQSVEKTLR